MCRGIRIVAFEAGYGYGYFSLFEDRKMGNSCPVALTKGCKKLLWKGRLVSKVRCLEFRGIR